MDSQFPTQTRVVTVGVGIVGCSVAYPLAKLGWKDVVLLEQNELAGVPRTRGISMLQFVVAINHACKWPSRPQTVDGKNESSCELPLMSLHVSQESAEHSLADSPTPKQRRVPPAGYALLLWFVCGASANIHAAASNSVARVWNERALAAIRVDTPHPPAQARNLFSLSVCMYDAWAAYDTSGAVGYVYRGKHTAADVAAARHEAISFAAYRILKERHAYSKTFTNTLAADD